MATIAESVRAVCDSSQADLDMAAAQPDTAITGSQAAFDRRLSAAEALIESAVVPYRGNLPLVRANIQMGVSYLRIEQSKYQPYGFSFAEFEAQLDTVDALAHALVLKRLAGPPDPSELPEIKSRVYWARRVMLSSLEAVAFADDDDELLSIHAKIKAGQGFIDSGEDVVALAEVFMSRSETFAGRSPVTRAMVLQADTDGRALISLITPKGAKRYVEAKERSAEDQVVDRFWSLLVAGHERMRKAGYLVWGDDFGRYVPPLFSREAPQRKVTEPESESESESELKQAAV